MAAGENEDNDDPFAKTAHELSLQANDQLPDINDSSQLVEKQPLLSPKQTPRENVEAALKTVKINIDV